MGGIDLVFRIAAIGMLITILNMILSKSGREELTTLVTIVGLVIVLGMVVREVESLFQTVRSIFGFL
ncbi:MAG TPA: stage III sporulation protein AC [Clostridiales bacterium]|nr:stage III sporulation protein AC [Clostridiales bacterium]